jgi:hypothetical protein
MTTFFTKSNSIDFIERVFGSGKLSNGGLNISVVCPECESKKESGYSKKKLVIRTDSFISHCWVCNTKSRNLVPWLRRWNPGFLNEYINVFLKSEQLRDLADNDSFDNSEIKNVVTLPEGYSFLLPLDSSNARMARRYLSKDRGIKEEKDFWYWKFGIVDEAVSQDHLGRIIIPSFDKTGTLNYWTGRSFKRGVFPKYINPSVPRESIIFNEINIDWKKPLVLVEGPFDLIKCTENATCLLGSTLNSDYVLFRKIVENETPVILALDNDAREKTLEIAKNFLEYGVEVSLLKIPETREDVGAMSKGEFEQLQNSAGIAFTTENFLLEKIRLTLGS